MANGSGGDMWTGALNFEGQREDCRPKQQTPEELSPMVQKLAYGCSTISAIIMLVAGHDQRLGRPADPTAAIANGPFPDEEKIRLVPPARGAGIPRSPGTPGSATTTRALGSGERYKPAVPGAPPRRLRAACGVPGLRASAALPRRRPSRASSRAGPRMRRCG